MSLLLWYNGGVTALHAVVSGSIPGSSGIFSMIMLASLLCRQSVSHLVSRLVSCIFG